MFFIQVYEVNNPSDNAGMSNEKGKGFIHPRLKLMEFYIK